MYSQVAGLSEKVAIAIPRQKKQASFIFRIRSETFLEQAPAPDHVKQPASNDPALPYLPLTSPEAHLENKTREQLTTLHSSESHLCNSPHPTPWPYPSNHPSIHPVQPPSQTSYLTSLFLLRSRMGALPTPLMRVTSPVSVLRLGVRVRGSGYISVCWDGIICPIGLGMREEVSFILYAVYNIQMDYVK